MKCFVLALICVALFSFSLGEVAHYKLAIEEKGTRFSEDVELDERNNVGIFKVPTHNDVYGAEFFHDFNLRLTATKILSRKVCYVSEMDPALLSSMKLKADFERAAAEPGKLRITTTSSMVEITEPANKFALSKEILDFCGSLPMYNTESIDVDTNNENKTAIIEGKLLRRRRQLQFQKFERSCKSMGDKNTNGGKISFSKLEECVKLKKDWGMSCKMKAGTCFYFVTCERKGRTLDYICKEVHKSSELPVCCDYICL